MKRWTALTSLLLFVTLLLGTWSSSAWAQEEAKPAAEAAPAAESAPAMDAAAEPEADPKAPIAGDELKYAIDSLFMLIFAVLVILMQAGFALVETGLNSSKNAVNIMFKNMMDFCIGVMLFWLFGFNLMYPGGDYAAKWLPPIPTASTLQVARDTEPDLAYGLSHSTDFMFQVAFAATAATIVSGAVAGRLKFSAYLLYSAFITGLVYPISGFWKWGGGALADWGFQDFAGSLVVHAVGGFAGLAGALALGPRLGRFTAEGKSRPIPGHDIPIACLGVFLLLIGWYGFNPGSQLHYAASTNAEMTTYIAMTTTLAAAAGAIIAMATAWCLFGKPDLTMAMNGMLAGLVGITANCDRVSQTEAVIIGAVAGVLVVLGIIALEKLRIDDPVGAFPVHGICGLWGGVATGLFGDIPDGLTWAGFVKVQCLSSAIIAAWAFCVMAALFFGLKAIGMLRVTPEEEMEGLDIGEHGMHAYYLDSPPV